MTYKAMLTAVMFQPLGMSVGNPLSLFKAGLQSGLRMPVPADTGTLLAFVKGGMLDGTTPFMMGEWALCRASE